MGKIKGVFKEVLLLFARIVNSVAKELGQEAVY
jgi:hypothetical protein